MALAVNCTVAGLGEIPAYLLVTHVVASKTQPGVRAVVELYRDQATRQARGAALAAVNEAQLAFEAAQAALQAKVPPADATAEQKAALALESIVPRANLDLASAALGQAQAALNDPGLSPLPGGTLEVNLPPTVLVDGAPSLPAIYAWLKQQPAFAGAADI